MASVFVGSLWGSEHCILIVATTCVLGKWVCALTRMTGRPFKAQQFLWEIGLHTVNADFNSLKYPTQKICSKLFHTYLRLENSRSARAPENKWMNWQLLIKKSISSLALWAQSTTMDYTSCTQVIKSQIQKNLPNQSKQNSHKTKRTHTHTHTKTKHQIF